MVPFKPDGGVNGARIALNLLRRPMQLPAVLRLGAHTRTSAQMLAKISHVLV
jgi:hypothetical protein